MTSIDDLLLKEQGVKLRGDVRWAFLEATLLYIFRGITSTQYKKKLRLALNTEESCLEFKNSLLNNGHIMKDLKIGISRNYRQLNNRIIVPDKPLLELVKNPTAFNRLLKKQSKYKALDVPVFDKILASVIQELEVYCTKFVYKKMGFIIRAYGVEAHDIVLDIMCRSIASVYHYYPCYESKLHLENLFKKFIHNYGINYIYRQTTDKRARLTNTNGEFSNNLVPIEVAMLDKSFNDLLSVGIEGGNEVDLDLKIEVLKVVNSVGDKRAVFLRLLMGYYNQEFSDYLVSQGIKTPNDEFLDRCLNNNIDRYVKLVLKFLEVSEASGYKYITSLQDKFEPYRKTA